MSRPLPDEDPVFDAVYRVSRRIDLIHIVMLGVAWLITGLFILYADLWIIPLLLLPVPIVILCWIVARRWILGRDPLADPQGVAVRFERYFDLAFFRRVLGDWSRRDDRPFPRGNEYSAADARTLMRGSGVVAILIAVSLALLLAKLWG